VRSAVPALLGLPSGRPLLVTAVRLVDETEGGPDEQQKRADEHDRGAHVGSAVVNCNQHHQRTRRRRSEDEPLPHAVSFLAQMADGPSILPLDESRTSTLI
jgi:hypothetical protein